MERVVITGLGLVSVLGHTNEAVSTSLREGRSGIVKDPEREALGFRSPLTGAWGADACACARPPT